MRHNLLQSPLLIGLLLVFLLTACNPADAAPADSTTTGEITVYTTMDEEVAEKYLADFRQQYPEIEVDLVRESTGLLTQRLLTEVNDPKTDVIWGVPVTSLLLAEWNDLLEPYAPTGLERILPLFRDTTSPPNWVGIDVLMSAFCVNPAELERLGLPMPQSWQDLLDPVYQGHLVMPNPNDSGVGYVMVSDLLYLYGEQNGWDYLDGLGRNVAQYTTSDAAPCRLAATGEYAIGLSSVSAGVALESEETIEAILPEEDLAWGVRANALVRKIETKPAALTFLDWAISDEAIALYAQDRVLTAAQPDDALSVGTVADPMAHFLNKDIPWAAANRMNILTEWSERYGAKAEPSSD